VIILFVTSLSTLFPAVIATRVSPLRAMQSDE
jgi:ABC-type lipoprotein release transport system permease subunit